MWLITDTYSNNNNKKNSDPLKAEEGNVTVCVYVLDKTNKMAFEVNRDKAIEGYVAPAT